MTKDDLLHCRVSSDCESDTHVSIWTNPTGVSGLDPLHSAILSVNGNDYPLQDRDLIRALWGALGPMV